MMFNFRNCLTLGFAVSATTLITLGLSSGPALATGSLEEFENERVVRVNCDRGQSVQRVLNRFANRTKPLEVIIKGNCTNEPDEEIQIERDNVALEGDEEVGATIPFVLVDGARVVGIGGTLTLTEGIVISAGQVEMGTQTNLTVNGTILLTPQSLLRITAEESEDDEESFNGSSPGQAVFNGIVLVENHSLLEVQREISGGSVIFNNEIILNLQSSLWMRDASVGNIVLGNDAHAVLVENVVPQFPGVTSISCDSESRVWGDTSGFMVLNDVKSGASCQGD